jgi:hypothetical protein
MVFRRKTQEAAQMAWPMEMPFYSEEVRQHDVGSKKEEVKRFRQLTRERLTEKLSKICELYFK